METTPNLNKSWAEYYLKLGWPIFPVSSTSKVPLVKWGEFVNRLPTLEEVDQWWTKWPDADIGLVTGQASNRLVLDVDTDEGREWLKDKELPVTPTVLTAKGIHYHFAWPFDSDERKTTLVRIAPGIDTRGTGGYVKLPPSKTGENYYAWKEGRDYSIPLAEVPEWLKNLLTDYKDQKESDKIETTSEGWLETILQGVGDGERHSALVRLAGYYSNFMSRDIVAQHLREWNKKNKPPIDSAELEEQIRSFSDFGSDSKFTSIRSSLEVLTATELVQKFSGKIDWLVDHLIPRQSTTIFSAWQGRGKSFIATDLAIEISRTKGRGKWLGTFDVANGSVIYIDNEMSPHLASFRIQDLLKGKHLITGDVNLHYLSRSHFKLTNEQQYLQLRQKMEDIQPVLVIVDSFASTHTLDENDSANMRHFFDDLVAPLSDYYNCAFMFIDHERKDETTTFGGKRLRGSGAKGDAVDQIISLNEKDGMLIFENPKARYARQHTPFVVEIEGTYADGFVIKNLGYIQK